MSSSLLWFGFPGGPHRSGEEQGAFRERFVSSGTPGPRSGSPLPEPAPARARSRPQSPHNRGSCGIPWGLQSLETSGPGPSPPGRAGQEHRVSATIGLFHVSSVGAPGMVQPMKNAVSLVLSLMAGLIGGCDPGPLLEAVPGEGVARAQVLQVLPGKGGAPDDGGKLAAGPPLSLTSS